MRKALMIGLTAILMAACGTTGSSLTGPTHNPLKPGPPVFDPGNQPYGR